MECRHYKDGKCEVDCRCNGIPSKCNFIASDLSDDNPGVYKFLLAKSMELLEELSEHLTCSLPCIYCKKYDENTVCDGQFEWVYKDRIEEFIHPNSKKESEGINVLRHTGRR